MSRPRRLTEEEIENVVSVIDEKSEISVRSPVISAARLANEALRNRLRRDLSVIEIVPEGLEKLKAGIRTYFLKSLALPGTPVGFQVSEAIGGPATQMSLNAFHTAGSSVVSETGQGIERIQQLIDLTKKPRQTITTIHFRQSLSYAEIYIKLRREILEVTVGNLVNDFDIEEIALVRQERPTWYDLYESVYGLLPEARVIMRLEMNTKNMIAFGVTMEEVARAIEKSEDTQLGEKKNKVEALRVAFSPMSIGLIDIYPLEDILLSGVSEVQGEINRENASDVFLTTIVAPNLDNVRLSGLSGVKRGVPQSTPVLNIIDSEEEIQTEDGQQYWMLLLSERRVLTSGVTKEMLSRLLKLIGLEEYPTEERYRMFFPFQGPGPLTLARQTLAGEVSPEISTAGTYHFAEVVGGKYSDILELEDVRPELTLSNNIHEINEALGVEAARKFYIREFYNLFVLQGNYIDLRHLELMADFIALKGILSAINVTGIGRQDIGALAKATYRKPMEKLSQAAAAGERHNVRAISSSVLIGKEPRTGVGYTDVLPNKTRERELLAARGIILPQATLDYNNFSDGIDQLEDLTFGQRNYTLSTKDLDEIFGSGPAPPLTPTSLGTGLTTSGLSYGSSTTPRTQSQVLLPTPLQEIVPAPVVSDLLVDVLPRINNITVSEQSQSTLVQGELGSGEKIPRGQRNSQALLQAENAVQRLETPGPSTVLTFARTNSQPQARSFQLASTADLLADLEEI